MDTTEEILDNLKFLGYDGKYLQSEVLNKCLDDGPKSEEFRELVQWLCFEIHILRNTEEEVQNSTEFSEFMLELSGLLKELGCQYDCLVAGPLTDRYQTKESRYLLLDYLISELMAAKMYFTIKPKDTSYIIPKFESHTARSLETVCKDLALGKPPDNIGAKSLFEKINNKLGQMLKQENPKKLSEPLLKLPKPFNDQQWDKLENVSKELDEEYSLRKDMLMTRLDVTIQSFQWSDKMKGKADIIVNRYQEEIKKVNQLNDDSSPVSSELVNLLAARTDLAIIEKTSNAAVRKNTGSKIQKHVIGQVPDRGGRAYEHAPPPPEMPSWQQQRSSGPTGGGNRGGGGRGGRGGQPYGSGPMNQRPRNDNYNSQQNNQQPNYQQQNYQSQNYQQQNYQQQNYQQPQYSGSSSGPQWQRGDQQSSRVQGGWSNKGNFDNGVRSNNSANNYGDYQENRRGGSRGRSNYNRGGFRN